MRKLSRKSFFASLDAPLKNAQWSWGAKRLRDRAVFLCVWNDQVRSDGDRQFVLVLRPEDAHRLGGRERDDHLVLVRNGVPCYLVFLDAKDPTERTRTFKSFDSRNVVRARQVVQRGDEVWIELGETIPADTLMQLS